MSIPQEVSKRHEVQQAVETAVETAVGRINGHAEREKRWKGVWEDIVFASKRAKTVPELMKVVEAKIRYMTSDENSVIRAYEAKLKEVELRLKQTEIERTMAKDEPITVEYQLVGGLDGDA